MVSQLPQITVAIPTVDRPEYLKETLESVLKQTWPALDILISDNASGPATAAYLATVSDSRVRKFRQDNRLSMAAHWNQCLQKAEGHWFLLLSDDDLLEPQALQALMAVADQPSVAMAYSPFVTIDGRGVVGMASAPGAELVPGTDFIREHLARRLTVMPSGLLARTKDLRDLGGFPETGTTSDLGMRLLLAARGQVACLPTPVLAYRVHGSNLSGHSVAVVESHLALLHWARGRSELDAYFPYLAQFTARRILGCGLRSAIQGDQSGVEAVRRVLSDANLEFTPWLIGRPLAQILMGLAGQAWFRWAVSLRDRWLASRRSHL